MRKVDRNAIGVPASIGSQAARAEYKTAADVAALRIQRAKALQSSLTAHNTANGTTPENELQSEIEAKFSFKVYRAGDIRLALEELFYKKCAYCETRYAHQAPVDIEHYRPKGAVEDEKDHPGYWWLAADWDNLLPSCIDCNRRRTQILWPLDVEQGLKKVNFVTLAKSMKLPPSSSQAGKKDAFPIAGRRWFSPADSDKNEFPYLLNPTIDEPDEHLDYYLDHERDGVEPLAVVLPRIVVADENYRLPGFDEGDESESARGLLTIQYFGLNRLHLVQERTAVLRRLEFLRALLAKIDSAIQSLSEVIQQLPAPLADRLQRVSLVLEGVIDSILTEMQAATKPEEPYSALASRWMQKWHKSLLTSTNKPEMVGDDF